MDMADLYLWHWLLIFVSSGAVLSWAGTMLARSGDEIATRTGIGRVLIGSLLVAGATSLPEITTDVSAAASGNPELAVGDLFGSSMANMAILAVIDLMRRRRIWPAVELGHARVAAIAMALTALALIGILTPEGLTFGWVGGDSVLIAVAYVAAIAWMRRSRPRDLSPTSTAPVERVAVEISELPVPIGLRGRERAELRSTIIRFALSALLILLTGPVTARSAAGIAQTTGIGQTFIGAALLAVATSLPELATAVAAVRIGAEDLAVGNLFGSNAWNMSVLLLVDLAYTSGPVLTGLAGPAEAVAGVGAILMMAVALAAIVHGQETRIGRLEPDAILLLLVYVGALAAVWSVS